MIPVVALYIDPEGPYPLLGLAGVYDEARDARTYDGPFPVVAHPPCAGWGVRRMIRRDVQRKAGWTAAALDVDARRTMCGPLAVDQVRRFGGVLEHPENSALWDYASLPAPGFADEWGGRTYQLHQCNYGHPCPKPTRLYIVGHPRILDLDRRPTPASGRVLAQWSTVRHLTPEPFARLLVDIAAECKPGIHAKRAAPLFETVGVDQ